MAFSKNIREQNHGDVSWQFINDRIINLSDKLLAADGSDTKINT
ncbi:hypothetical protein APA_2429 [Pseudanabaena sp. lw0831]|nr:hypothetical protein [Pseudanabaena sp. lw0831]GBO54482.1 hypothetical protein APA_2429 [Pseudanabaena sp. lw0831]